LKKISLVDQQITRLEKTYLPPGEELNRSLIELDTTPLEHGSSLASLLRRPQLNIHFLIQFDQELALLPLEILEQIEVEIVYSGYIKQQREQVERQLRMEDLPLDETAEYLEIHGISKEAREKMQRIRPRSIGQASRISGVSPADISVLMIWLEQQRRKGERV
jgi:tRNA uridine 5-carboxymethylaminomethyl modification enzyme